MCGRYASSRPVDDLLVHFDVEEPPEQVLPPSWNVAPTDPVYVVLERHERRRLQVVRWGLVPSWAKDRKIGARLINARRETLADKPAFRSAYQRRRCLVPADGYYEWQVLGGGPRGTDKQPWYLTARRDSSLDRDPSLDGDASVDRDPAPDADPSPDVAGPLAMAGLYEVWRDPEGALLWTCTVVTTEAADDHGQIHDRTPLLVPRAAWGRWLDPELPDPGADLLVPGTAGVLDAWPVAGAVGNVRNNGPELVTPLPG